MNELVFTGDAHPHLQDVERAYAIEERLASVINGISKRDAKLSWVFRDHTANENDVIVEPDVTIRSNFDLLLGAISALHIGGLGSSRRDNPLGVHRLGAGALLSNADVQRYYESYYPCAMPILARHALWDDLPAAYKKAWKSELKSDAFEKSYRSFLHLDARFVANGALGDFLALLDDYFVGGEHITDLIEALKSPQALAAWLEAESAETQVGEARWQIIEGMSSFYEFALDLDEYLESGLPPLLRGHVWLHFAYWFGKGGERMTDVSEWLAKVTRQVGTELLDTSVSELGACLSRLRDPFLQAGKVFDLSQDILDPWLISSGAREE